MKGKSKASSSCTSYALIVLKEVAPISICSIADFQSAAAGSRQGIEARTTSPIITRLAS
jgi:hypothetical protein